MAALIFVVAASLTSRPSGTRPRAAATRSRNIFGSPTYHRTPKATRPGTKQPRCGGRRWKVAEVRRRMEARKEQFEAVHGEADRAAGSRFPAGGTERTAVVAGIGWDGVIASPCWIAAQVCPDYPSVSRLRSRAARYPQSVAGLSRPRQPMGDRKEHVLP